MKGREEKFPSEQDDFSAWQEDDYVDESSVWQEDDYAGEASIRQNCDDVWLVESDFPDEADTDDDFYESEEMAGSEPRAFSESLEDMFPNSEEEYEPLNGQEVISSASGKAGRILRAIFREAVGFVISLAVAWIAVMFLVTYVGTLCTVDGSSMENTLHDGDRLWADKLTYRFSDPQRFDIIIFPPQYDSDSKYIKRIIGLPGETVSIDEEGNIYIDGEILTEDYGKEVIRAENRGSLANGEITLGEDEYFVLGDNRNESLDSRYEIVGTVKRSDIFGKAVFRIWPLSDFGFLD